MEFIISSSDLLKHLQSISGVLNSSSNLPILDNFLFEAQDSLLTISASDLDTTMRTTVMLDNPSRRPGRVAIPARLLLDVLKNLQDQPCNFSADEETFAVEITYENGRSRMAGYNSEEFPKMPNIENSKSITINGKVITTAINTTLFAAGNDDLRKNMTGVNCTLSEKEVVFVATDAQKFSCYKRADIGTNESDTASFILPKKPLKLLTSNINDDMEIKFEYNTSNAVFSFGDIVLVCRLIDGVFPDWQTAIPKEIDKILSVDRVQLLNALKRVSVFANKSSHRVQLQMNGAKLIVSAEDLDYNNEANEELLCRLDGEDCTVGFNARTLLDMLSILPSKEVHLEIATLTRPCIVKPSEVTHENEDMFMLIMPVAAPNVEYA